MQISSSFFEGFLLIDVPFVFLYFLLSYLISDDYLHNPSFFERLSFFLFMLLLGFFADKLAMLKKKTKTLFLKNNKIILDNHEIDISNILSIEFIKHARNGFDTILFEIKQDEQIKEVYVMDKPGFMRFWSPSKSKTLEYLYDTFPELQDKEIQKR